MKIISAPHQSLRQIASEITTVDKKLKNLIADLEKTLQERDNPKGVGLAAPQVDKSLRLFATQLSKTDDYDDLKSLEMAYYLNPVITKHAGKQTFGEDKKHPQLEGCLSIPNLYGPVPRWEWVELDYFTLKGDELVKNTTKFTGFAARVIQHETDHLNGVLFTDYTLQYDLPIYLENKKSGELEEVINKKVLESL